MKLFYSKAVPHVLWENFNVLIYLVHSASCIRLKVILRISKGETLYINLYWNYSRFLYINKVIQQIRDTIGEQQQHLVSVSDISAVPQHSGMYKMPPEANSICALLRKVVLPCSPAYSVCYIAKPPKCKHFRWIWNGELDPAIFIFIIHLRMLKRNRFQEKKNTYWNFIVPKTFYEHWSH